LSVFDINWSGASTNTTFQSNIILSSDDPNVASGTRSHNLCGTSAICLGTDQVIGTPTFEGGSPGAITTFSGWRLASTSIGKGSSHDGRDRGVDFTSFGTGTPPAPGAPTNVRIITNLQN
jgi:hypothetical protein